MLKGVSSQFLSGPSLNNLAHRCWLADEPAAALSWALWAVRPQAWLEGKIHRNAFRTLGHVLIDHGRYQEADLAYQHSDPDDFDPNALLGRALAAEGMHLRKQAAVLAEARFLLEKIPHGALPKPHWKEWPNVEQLTLWDEQGFGDTIQETRWLPAILQQPTSVTLAVRSPLVRLMREGLAWLGPQLKVVDRDESAFDGCHGSLLSLHWRLQHSFAAEVNEPVLGWFRLPATAVERPSSGRRIGLIWAAGRYSESAYLHREATKKSLPLFALQGLVKVLEAESCELVCLQTGPDRDEAEVLKLNWQDELQPDADFYGLAQMMKGCDLIITVDTAAAHLAGALGVQAWLLLPWAAAARWGRDSQTTSLYASLRLFRQRKPRDWNSVNDLVRSALRQSSSSTEFHQHNP